VQNRDSRAGAATDAELSGADINTVRQALGHSKEDTTRLYLRAEHDATERVAKLRGERGKNRDSKRPTEG
jgi:hypothetical protein